jgi:hypothetical protein
LALHITQGRGDNLCNLPNGNMLCSVAILHDERMFVDTATCTENNHSYTAVEFSQLPPGELAQKRRRLICDGCGFVAFFRKPSRSGRGACFGARPHNDGCEAAAADNEIRVPGVGDDQDEVFNPGDRIVVELAFGGQEQQPHVDGDPRAPRRPRAGRYVGEGGPRYGQLHRRLSTLLRLLVTAPNFRYSDQVIAVDGRPELPAFDFFVQLGDVTPQHSAQFRGYWGQLTDARYVADGSLWLNSGGRSEMSFCLKAEHVGEVMTRFRLDDEEELAGIYILVLGTLHVSSRTGKMVCIIEDPALVTLR